MKTANRARRTQDRHRARPRLEALEGRALLSASGSLDSTFGGTGSATFPLGVHYYAGVQALTYPAPANYQYGTTVNPQSVAAGGDGKVVTSAFLQTFSNTNSFGLEVVRDNANGTLDTTFGSNGLVVVPIGGKPSYYRGSLTGYSAASVATAVQSDGKILVATEVYDDSGDPTFVAVRLNLNGSLDASYGTNGIAAYSTNTTTPVANRLGDVKAALIQSDGKLVLVGSVDGPKANTGTFASPFAAVRLDTAGMIDPTYGIAGTADVPVTVQGYTQDTVVGASLQADGQVIVAGNVLTDEEFSVAGYETFYRGSVIRLGVNGTLDTSYGGSTAKGIVTLPDSPATAQVLASGVAIDPTDGKVLVSGSDNNYPASNLLYRLNTDGTPDTGFGTGGMIRPALYGSVAVEADGKIILASSTSIDYGQLERLDTDGTPDPTFGNPATPGLFKIQPAVTSNVVLAIDQADGDILVAGTGSTPSPTGRMLGLGVFKVLTRANANPPAVPPIAQPANLDGSGQTNAAVFEPTSLPNQGNTGTFVVQTVIDRTTAGKPTDSTAFGLPGVGQSLPAVADYAGSNASDPATYQVATGTFEILANGTNTQTQFGTPGAGQSIPVPANYDGTGQADLAVYLVSSGTFAIRPFGSTAPARLVQFGIAGPGRSIPAPADYYGTGQADVAVYLEQAGAFAVQDPTGQTPGEVVPFGMPGLGKSIPVPGDYDGSGHTELAVYLPTLGIFAYRPYGGGPDKFIAFGTPNSGELPVVGDYDGSGRTEVAVYDPSRGFIAYRPAMGGADVVTFIGQPNSGAIPVATPAGALPEFAAPGSGGGNAIRPGEGGSAGAGAIVSVPGSSVAASSASGGGTRTSSLPTPIVSATVPSARTARTPVNQEAPKPSWDPG